jgi:hypothetical protein
MIDSLILWSNDRSKLSLGQRFALRDLRRNEIVVQCYLFSNHLVITTRASNGKLHLVKVFPLDLIKLFKSKLFFLLFKGLRSYSIS